MIIIKDKMHILKFVLLFIFSSFIFSQDYDPMQGGYVRGGVIDDITELPKPHANISVVKADSDKIIQGGVADEEGLFFIDKIPYGIYYVVVEYVGYQDYIIDDVKIYPTHLEINLETIRLVSKALILEGVEIVEQMPVIEDIAKTTYPVAETARAEGGSADDILEKLPSVSVDVDGNIALRGNSNVTILIDGRKSKMSVDMINANMIEKVEVMTTPSSKYDPDGIAGIINIVLNKNQYIGKSGNLGINIDDKKSINFSGTLNSFNDDWNIFGSYSIKSKNKEGEGFRNTSLVDNSNALFSSSNMYGVTDKDRDNANIKLGFERYFKGNDMLAFDITFLKYKNLEIENGNNLYRFLDSQNQQYIDEFSIGLNKEETEGDNLNFGIGYYKSNDSTGSDFTIEFDYEDNDKQETNNMKSDKIIDCHALSGEVLCEEESPYCSWNQLDSTCNYNSDMTILSEYKQETSNTFRVDFSSPFSKENEEENYELGIKIDYEDSNRDLEYDNEPFKYINDNKILAAYFNTTFNVTDNLDMQVGFRFEDQEKNARLNYDESLGSSSSIDECNVINDSAQCDAESFCDWDDALAICVETDFKWALDLMSNKDFTYEHREGIRIFPSVYFIYNFEEGGSLKLSSARRINRPWYRNVNPIPNVTESMGGIKFINVGNPTLVPEDIIKSEIQYSNKISIKGFTIGFMKAAAYYEDVSDKIDHDKDTEFINNEVYQVLSFENNSRSRKLGFELLFATEMQKFGMMINGNWWNERTWGAPEADGFGTEHGFWGMLVGELKLKNDQKVSMYSHHSTPMKITTGTIKPFRRMDLTYKKEVSPRFNFTIKLKDVFDTGGFRIETDYPVLYDDLGDQIPSNDIYFNETLDAERRRDNRTLSINFEYKFGSFQKKKYKREKNQGYGGDGGGMDMSY